jgi:hypothetical protein
MAEHKKTEGRDAAMNLSSMDLVIAKMSNSS